MYSSGKLRSLCMTFFLFHAECAKGVAKDAKSKFQYSLRSLRKNSAACA